MAAEINDWFNKRKLLPTDDNEPFVLNFLVIAESLDVEEQDLKIVFSTRRLLRTAAASDLVQCDATYKLIWQGYPVIIVGEM